MYKELYRNVLVRKGWRKKVQTLLPYYYYYVYVRVCTDLGCSIFCIYVHFILHMYIQRLNLNTALLEIGIEYPCIGFTSTLKRTIKVYFKLMMYIRLRRTKYGLHVILLSKTLYTIRKGSSTESVKIYSCLKILDSHPLSVF